MSATREEPSQLEQIVARQRRQQQRFSAGVNLSYAILLTLLVFVFSGFETDIGPIHISTIQLDFAFIGNWIGFIFGGVGLTILLAILSIALACILALLGALGRLSRIPGLCPGDILHLSHSRHTVIAPGDLFLPGFAPARYPPLRVVRRGTGTGAELWGLHDRNHAGGYSIGGHRPAGSGIGHRHDPKPDHAASGITPGVAAGCAPIGNEFIAMLKDTSLISVTGFVREILWRAQNVGQQRFRSLETLLVAALFYWIITILFSAVQKRLETYLAKGERIGGMVH